MWQPRGLIVFLVVAAAACAGSTERTPINDPGDGTEHFVRNIRLSNTRGEVGKPFSAELTWEDNFIEEAEFDVSGVPPGLRFDAAGRSLVGKPTKAGFYTFNISVRKKLSKGDFHKPKADERWWPASFEVAIYAPVGD